MREAVGEPLDVPPWTVPEALVRTAREHADRPAFLRPRPDGRVESTSWAAVTARVERLAAGLVSLGLRPGERVAIVSETREEWAVADLAILSAGGVTVAVFPTLPPAQTLALLADSGARYAFVEDATQLAKLQRADAIERLFLFEGAAGEDKRAAPLADLDADGARVLVAQPTLVEARRSALRPETVATIVYTSGTTGVAKGVLLTHRNLIASAVASIRRLELRPHPVGVAFLPLAHSYQRQNAVVLLLLAGAVAWSSPARLADDLRVVRPTLLPAVPRLYERMQERIHEKVRQMPPRRQRIFAAAERAAVAYGRATQEGARPGAALRAKHALFERLVYRRLRTMAGLDRLDLAITGAAAMRADLLCFFRGIGVRIVEGWGLSETTAPATVNTGARFKAGSVGAPLPGVRVALDEDGEILVSGPIVFAGYHGMPKETAEAFVERDGARWFRTGDLGSLDADGHLRIVDRKKDLEVLDTGKKVAPMPIEDALKATPLVAEALVVATGQKFVGALLQPRFEALLAWARLEGIAVDEAGVRRGVGPAGEDSIVAVPAALLAEPRVRARFDAAIEQVNVGLAPHERVRAYRVVPEAFRAENGDLTPTLKKRRAAILARHATLVEEMFSAARPQ